MPQATRIIAIRHGETAWNVDTRIQGQLDIDLNDKGRWQAEQAGRALAGEALDAVYASDLSRAFHTAQTIARVAAPLLQVQSHVGLRERAFGKFQGQTYAAIQEQWPEEARLWRIRDPDFAPEGGETPNQVLARVAQTVNAIAAQHLGQQIVIVSHGAHALAGSQAVEHVHHAAVRTWDLGNTAINRLLWTPDALTLVGWADTRHLDGAQRDEFGA